MKISAVIIAGNEEAKIAEAIRSVLFADEVLVVDSESSDATRAIAEGLGARVVVQPWLGFAKQKQLAVDLAEHDWVLSIDADERVSSKLREEILALERSSDALADAYRIPRLTNYMGRDIRHCGWYPDWQTRLFNRKKGRWLDVLVHESFQLFEGGNLGELRNDLLHFSIDGALEHHNLLGDRYAKLAAHQMFDSGRRTGLLKIMSAGPAAFLSTYFLKLGFLDGAPGFMISKFAAHHAFLKHLLLWEMQRASEKG